jgi:hypothetical protein
MDGAFSAGGAPGFACEETLALADETIAFDRKQSGS